MALGLYDTLVSIKKQIRNICCRLKLVEENCCNGGGGSTVLTALPFTTDHVNANGNQYVIGDVVYYNGNIYRCIANNDSIIPTSTSYWVNLGAGYPLVEEPINWNSTTGNNQILNKPTIPAAQVNSDWNAVSGVAEILNKPVIPTQLNGTGFVKASGTTISYDNNSYALTSDVVNLTTSQSISGTKTFQNQTIFTSPVQIQLGQSLIFYNVANTFSASLRAAPALSSNVNFYLPVTGAGATLATTDDIPFIPQLEHNLVDRTIWNNGKGNIISNTSFGDSALKSNTTGANNIALGYKALEGVTLASRNIGIGVEALNSNSSFGNDNVAIGYRAGKSITTGGLNVAIGNNAFVNGNSSYTTAVGNATLQNSNINGNTGIGANVMDTGVITGPLNVGVGFSSLSQLTSGQENTAIGYDSLSTNTVGSNNSALGSSTRSGNFSGSVLLGKGATATANNQFVVGSVGTNAGTVTNAAASQTHYWAVKINGTDYKILLST
jgi:hypothetical protein